MKLFYKYYLMIAIPLISCLLIIGTSLSIQMYGYSVAEKRDSLTLIAEKVADMTEELYYNNSAVREGMMKFLLTSFTSDRKTHIIICDTNGQIFLTSDPRGNKFIGSRVDPVIIDKTEQTENFSMIGTLGGLYEGENFSLGVTSRSNIGTPVAYVYVTTSISNIMQLMRYVASLFIFLSLIVFVITAFVSYFIVKKMTKPLNQITDASRKFANGNFSTRVPLNSADEIGELTTAFNNMADSLEKSEDLRRSFIANVSHEFRSPMTSIAGFVDGILDGTIPSDKSEHYLRIVSDEVHRLSRLVSRMLDITVLQSTDITKQSTTFDFCELVQRAVASFEGRLLEKNIFLNAEIPSHRISIFANEDSIHQVIYNLTDNAIKFSSENSQIDISVLDKGDSITFSVRNYGVEIPEEQLKYVFDRFHKTDRSRSKDRSGLGLGLYIAKTIINQHKGKIWALSENNKTEFFFSLPLKSNHGS